MKALFRLLRASVGQTGAAPGAAARQHLAAISGTHALAEPVLLGALALLGLIGTNHFGYTSCTKIKRSFPRPPQQPDGPGCGRQSKIALHRMRPHDADDIIAYFKMACQLYFFPLDASFFTTFFPVQHIVSPSPFQLKSRLFSPAARGRPLPENGAVRFLPPSPILFL